MNTPGCIRRVVALLLAALLAAGLSLTHVAHAAPAGGAAAAQALQRHGHGHPAPDERAGHKSALCCFVLAQAPLVAREPAEGAACAFPGVAMSEGQARAPPPPPPRPS